MILGHRALAQQFIQEIGNGQLAPGVYLPPSRKLAKELGVSRDTVVKSYELMRLLGYVETKTPHGTFVTQGAVDTARMPVVREISDFLSNVGKSVYLQNRTHPIYSDFPELNFGAAPIESIPIDRWKGLIARNKKSELADDGAKAKAEIHQYLSQTAATFLKSKNIDCASDQVFIINNSVGAIETICRLLLNVGDTIAVEEPGFGGIKNVAHYQGMNLHPVSVDEKGLIVEELNLSAEPPKLVYVTAASHNPTGVAMSKDRKVQLIEWARTNRAWIVDDDYDGFFNHGKVVLPRLWSLDVNESVIYLCSLRQILFPLTTATICVVPKCLRDLFQRATLYNSGTVEISIQKTLAAMLEDGFVLKHANKWQKIFAARLRVLCYELKLALGHRVTIAKQSGGLSCHVRFNYWNEEQILKAAELSGLRLASIRDYYLNGESNNEFLINFSTETDDLLRACIHSFAQLLECRY